MTALRVATPVTHSGISHVSSYTIQSSDVLQEMRINVRKESSTTVLWYKERFLTENEIIDHVVHNPTNTLCWTIHRPAKRGWYIRLRSPAFAPGVFIPIIPVSTKSPHYSEAALSFHFQTNATTASRRPSLSSIHSYPPTPLAQNVQPPSPTAVQAKLEEIPEDRKREQRKQEPTTKHITQFILTPHSTQVAHPTSSSLLARALSALRNSRPSHSNSFTLSRLPSTDPSARPPPYASNTSSSGSPVDAHHSIAIFVPPPHLVLTFHDQTPLLTAGCFTGLLEIQTAEEHVLGIDASFWITVALTYLEFLGERESYLAALGD